MNRFFGSVIGSVVAAMLLCPISFAAGTELVDEVVAVVNQKLILHSEVEELLAMMSEKELASLQGEAREERLAALRADVVEGLISQELMEQAMDRGGVSVDDREVESAIADVARQNRLTVEELMVQLERQGMQPDEYRREMKKQIRQYRFMELEIRTRVNVTEEDIRAHYQRETGARDPEPAWRLQRILLNFAKDADEAARAAVKEEAAVLLTQLSEGKDFAEVARVRSDDAVTAKQGGDAGIFKKKDLSAAFREALESVEPGAAVRVDTSRGVFLLRIAEEVDAGVKAFEEVRDSLARALNEQALEKELQLWTSEERNRAHVEVFR